MPFAACLPQEGCRRATWVTAYFAAIRSRPDRAIIREDWIERGIAHPIREYAQADGRIRRWTQVPEAGDRYPRVVLLSDGETVHNAFFDRRFQPRESATSQKPTRCSSSSATLRSRKRATLMRIRFSTLTRMGTSVRLPSSMRPSALVSRTFPTSRWRLNEHVNGPHASCACRFSPGVAAGYVER